MFLDFSVTIFKRDHFKFLGLYLFETFKTLNILVCFLLILVKGRVLSRKLAA